MNDDTTTLAPSEPVADPVQRKLGHATEARWYCLDREGLAMLCKDEADARAEAADNDKAWPSRAPHRAVLLGEVAADVDILAAYSRSDGRREWVSVGTWLRPGEVVAHMDDPRPNVAGKAPAR